ncbi:hypothetical protein SD1617_2405 [Shigella dysenteriae 1617]|uniref:Uncharacterized protein n=1 Tax=Shigella dysenteriae WRSd3 TaxID=1401327 RepID=A0A090NAG3_SHIDY|nr:hypothetical protein SD1617_2405 [Shigella dysenteriae 1617]EFX9488434.1 hypothetical protein [Shigella dysenteriae]ESU76431.1 hypothetical protein WRSd3_04339 [Shigella dysenteriae WRSd3]ESU78190.1 hypothetical protein WRSd5_03987 [Shigella dysenteriae WRSd5]
MTDIEVRTQQRLQMLLFLREALFRCLPELAKFPPVGNVSHPLRSMRVYFVV